MGYLGLRGTEYLMKTPKGLLSHGFTSFSPPWQGRHERQRISVRVIGKVWQPCQVGSGGPGIRGVAAARDRVVCSLRSFTCSDLLPSVRPRLPKVPQPL